MFSKTRQLGVLLRENRRRLLHDQPQAPAAPSKSEIFYGRLLQDQTQLSVLLRRWLHDRSQPPALIKSGGGGSGGRGGGGGGGAGGEKEYGFKIFGVFISLAPIVLMAEEKFVEMVQNNIRKIFNIKSPEEEREESEQAMNARMETYEMKQLQKDIVIKQLVDHMQTLREEVKEVYQISDANKKLIQSVDNRTSDRMLRLEVGLFELDEKIKPK